MRKFLIALLVIFTSCGSNQERGENNDFETGIPGKLHGNYLVSELKENNLSGEDIIFRFDSITSEVTGNAGCNRLNSNYLHNETTITFQPAISTKMYCEGKMEREKQIIEVLPQISEIVRQNEEILLLSADKELLLKLNKTSRSE